jgi:hypothetical protein
VAGGIEVSCAGAAAAGADAVLPGSPAQIVHLERAPDGWFRGRVPGSDGGHIALLITAADGQAHWTGVTVDDGHDDVAVGDARGDVAVGDAGGGAGA